MTTYNQAIVKKQCKSFRTYNSPDNLTKQNFVEKTMVKDKLLPPYNPLYEDLEYKYTIQKQPTIHALADYLIDLISKHSIVWNEPIIEDPFEKINRHFYSGYGMNVIKPEVRTEIISIVTSMLPVKYQLRQTAWRSLIGLKYKERLEW